jgi:hypothetical protein
VLGHDQVVSRPLESVAELFAALNLTADWTLDDLLSDEYDDPDASHEIESDGTLIVIAYNRMGVEIHFPVTLEEFWDAVADNVRDVREMLSSEEDDD